MASDHFYDFDDFFDWVADMDILKRSFFYYLIAATLITYVDFKEVHRLRLEWFDVLMTLSSDQQRPKVRTMIQDYVAHLDNVK